MTLPVAIRPARGGTDLAFVYSNWLDSFKNSAYAGPIPMDLYKGAYEPVIDRLLSRPSVQLAVAHADEDDNLLHGFIAWEPPGKHYHHRQVCGAPAVLWLHVKHDRRQDGIAGWLMQHAGINPKQAFCYPFPPCKPGSTVMSEHWTGGNRDVFMYRYPQPDGR